ncbi:MAG: YqaJ viral recombinase family protein [Bacteroidales bacterium]
MSILKTFETRKDWLTERRLGIGASEVATVLGINPFDTPFALQNRKKGRLAEEAENEVMRAGRILESAVAQYFTELTDAEILKRDVILMYVDENKPFLRVSPDRVCIYDNEEILLECKTTQKEVNVDDIPAHWYVQVQYQLGVSGFKKAVLAWLVRGLKFGYAEINFDEKLYNSIVEEVEQFWNDCIIGDKEPALKDVNDVLLRYPQHVEGKAIEASAEALDYYTKLAEIKAKIKQMEEEKEEYEQYLKILMKDAENLSYCGKVLVTWRATKGSQTFDKEAFQKEHSALYEQYLKDVKPVRRFLLK